MRWRRIVREATKWGASFVTLLIAVIALYGFFRCPFIVVKDEFFGLAQGGVVWQRLEPVPEYPESGDSLAHDRALAAIMLRRVDESQARVQLERVRNAGGAWWIWVGRAGGVITLWPLLALTALAAALLWRASVRARIRERLNHCLGCGYDRRGIAADTPCPECGTAASST